MTKSRPIKTESAVKTPVSVFRASPLRISKNVSFHIEDSDHGYQRSRLRLVVAGQGDLLPRQYLAMSRDSFGCHHRGAGHATSIQWEGAKDAAQGGFSSTPQRSIWSQTPTELRLTNPT